MTRRVHRPFVVAEEGDHRFVWLGLDESDAEKGVLTNQYLVVDGDDALLIDPGGYFVFERVLETVQEFIRPENIRGIFYSHQDPDVAGSLNLLLDFFPNAKVYISSIWTRFLPHLTGAGESIDFIGLPDEGMEIRLGDSTLKAIPAHYLHSPGHFTLYDPTVRVLFTGDIGAAVFPKGVWYLFVEDFEEHTRLMEWFHRRFMACRRALDTWLSRVESLEIDVIAPQHGAIMTGENARRFLEWLRSLGPVGTDLVTT